MKRLSVLLFLLLTTIANAQQPKAVITGPKESISGDMVILDATQSQGLKFVWKMIWLPGEEQKSFLPVDSNTKCIFAAGVDRDRIFHFVLVAAGTNTNGGPEVDVATHDLLIKARGSTTPTDPTLPPSPTTKVTRVVYLYEKDNNPIPRQVEAALQKLNETGGVVANALEIDAASNSSQYKKAVEAGKDKLPCVVFENSDGVVKVISNPTPDDIAGALK